jgi:hypothetical protein
MVPIYWGYVSTGRFVKTFVNADLVSGVLTVHHALQANAPHVLVRNNNNVQVTADAVTYADKNTVTINLTSFGTLTGTSTASVSEGGQ